MGLDSLDYGKWRKMSHLKKVLPDLDFDQSMPNVRLLQAMFIYNMFESFKLVDYYFSVIMYTHIDSHTDRQTYINTL